MRRSATRRWCATAVLLCLTALLPHAGATARGCRPVAERVDAGTWTETPIDGLTGGPSAWRMDAEPDLVVVADFEGVLVSRDGGCRWARGLRFDDVAPELWLRAEDVDVVPRGGGRSVYVVAIAWSGAAALLLSSDDEGRTWSSSYLPPETSAVPLESAELSSIDRPDAPLYLTTVHRSVTGGLFASDDAGATWHRRALTTSAVPPGACVPGDACIAPPLREVVAGPRASGRLWAVTTSSSSGAGGVVRSDDGGYAWEVVDAPSFLHGPALVDVAPDRRSETVLVLGDFGDFALSRDDGRSWEVGAFPEVSAGSQRTQSSFDVAHTSGTFATILGDDREGVWAGNVMLFDGREWTNVSPPRYAGMSATDTEGARLAFAELTGAGRSYLMLSTTGRLAAFRPLDGSPAEAALPRS